MLSKSAAMWHGRVVAMSGFAVSLGVLDRQRISIGARVVLLLLCGGLTFIESLRSATPAEELGRLTALLSIAVVAMVVAATTSKSVWVPVVESAAVCLLVMSDGGPHESLLPYLLAPALDAGLLAGIAGAVYVAGASSATVLAARLLGFTEQDPLDYSTTAAEWIVLALLTGILAAWARKLGVRPTDRNEPYPAAYRLVSQLRTVSRQLSGGLDAVSLGQMLLEQTKERTALRPGGDLRPRTRRPAQRVGQRRSSAGLGQLAGR